MMSKPNADQPDDNQPKLFVGIDWADLAHVACWIKSDEQFRLIIVSFYKVFDRSKVACSLPTTNLTGGSHDVETKCRSTRR